MELLLPAGSPESLAAAIDGGADSVYMGGSRFGARAQAANFSEGQLRSAIGLLHSHGLKGYVTVNTLVKDAEMADALSYVSFLEEIGADAVIVQDKGLLQELQGFKVPLHASTQMGVHNLEGVQWAEDNRISRVILARELSLEEIESISSRSSMELEVFVHGALCYSVSGQCLFSSILGGRSGNRGACAQPCRKSYHLGAEKGHLLSTADLECLDLLPRLRDAGVASVKVEGRMRSPLYVNLAARAYSAAIRRMEAGGPPADSRDLELLRTVFNRGHGPGHLLGGPVRKTDHADHRGLFLGEHRFVDGRARIEGLRPGDGITLFRDGKAGGFSVAGEEANAPFPLADGAYDVYRTHDAAFGTLSLPSIDLDDGPVRLPRAEPAPSPRERAPRRGELSVYLSSLRSVDAVIDICDRVYFEHNRHHQEAAEACAAAGRECVAIMPRFTPEVPDMPSGPLMVHDPGQARRHADRTLYGSHHLNMFNGSFPQAFHQQTVSPELSAHELQGLLRRYRGRAELMVFGRIELMLARDPGLPEGTLVDEKGFRFPVNVSQGSARIMNSADLVLLEQLEDLDRMGVDSHGIDLRRRPHDLCRKVVEIFSQRDLDRRRELRKLCGKVTYGHHLRGVA